MNLLISVPICMLAAYGAFQLLNNLMLSCQKKWNAKAPNAHIVLSVKNQEETIESIIRAIAWEPGSGEVVAVDLGSEDDTPEILRRLEKEYSFLHYMNQEQYIDYISKT